MEVSEEQWQRMQTNRAAALQKRNASLRQWVPPKPNILARAQQPVFRCQTMSSRAQQPQQQVPAAASGKLSPSSGVMGELWLRDQLPRIGQTVRVVLEMCTPTKFKLLLSSNNGDQSSSFSQILLQHLSSMITSAKASEMGPWWPVYNLKDYDIVTDALKSMPGLLEYEPIPWPTRMVLERFLQAQPVDGCNIPVVEVEKLLERQLPDKLKESLLPFQWEGVRYALCRDGRCLLADEMGVGKTIQAIAIAACYREEWPLLVICPASLRLVWAEELERWLPFLSPLDVHLVFGRKNDPAKQMQMPKVVVVSYTMMKHLRRSMVSLKWGMLIVDESHNLRCTQKKLPCEETMAVLEVAQSVKRVVLLTGTPSLSRPFDIFHQVDCLRPGLLGKNKYEFASNYCGWQRNAPFQNFQNGRRLEELNILLRETVMVRRLKENVMAQLPPKRRQVICLQLSTVDVKEAWAASIVKDGAAQEELCKCGFTVKGACDCEDETSEDNDSDDEVNAPDKVQRRGKKPAGAEISGCTLGEQGIGVAKLRGFQEWLLNNPVFAAASDPTGPQESNCSTQSKMIIFAHHHKVLDGIQEFVQKNAVEFVRIDGTTSAQDRMKYVNRFQNEFKVKVAIIGVTAGGVGLNLSAAQSVIFVELPKSASEMLQAEDRAHRLGQKNSINIYIFCAKGTADDIRWQSLSRSLEQVSTMTNGAEQAIPGLEVFYCNSVINHASTPGPGAIETCLKFSDHDLNESVTSLKQNVATDANVDDVFLVSDTPMTFQNLSKTTPQMSETPACMVDSISTPEHLVVYNETSKTSYHMDGISSQPERLAFSVKENSTVDFPATSLMFEVSSNTGRIHLYLLYLDLPKPLGINFRPEDLENLRTGACEKGRSLPTWFVHSITHQDAAMSFWNQWSQLRPVIRKRLSGRPLLLPLSSELSCLKIQSQYTEGGLSKVRSIRRVTPSEEVGRAARPEGATWKKISFHKKSGLKESRTVQLWSVSGAPLCKFCQQPCKGISATRPECFDDLFCKSDCLADYLQRTSQRYLREELFELEQGVCVKCGLDCHNLVQHIQPLTLDDRTTYILQTAPQFDRHKCLLERLVRDPSEGNAWHADHIVPVADGGGECRLENMQTLCVVCHTNVTIEQNRQRRSELKRARQRLQMREGSLNLNDGEKRMQQELCDSSESDDDKELLEINVAGSAYSASSPNHNITNLRSTVLPVEDQGSLDEQPFDDEVLVKIKDKSSTYLASSSQTVVDLAYCLNGPILDAAEDQESLGAQVTDDKTAADHKGSSSCSGLSLKQKVDVSLRAAILTVDDQESLDDNQDNNFSSESESHGCTGAAPAAEGLVSEESLFTKPLFSLKLLNTLLHRA
ncbi:unnamed protein product [Sphagnum balticum]